MQLFNSFEYLMIDAANRYGLDKETFNTRINWAHQALMDGFPDPVDAKESVLYAKVVGEINNVRWGRPSGHTVGMDACSSGLQIMAAVTGCFETARNTGLIDTGEVPQIYNMAAMHINSACGTSFDGKYCKPPVMTHFYNSRKVPREAFGEDTQELFAFYDALEVLAPGPSELMRDMQDSWQPYALEHSWTLPDGWRSKVRVTETVDAKIEVDELDHATFTHRIKLFRGTEEGLSLPANIVHSIDGYVVREIVRRCNYDELHLRFALRLIESELPRRMMQAVVRPPVLVSLGVIQKDFDKRVKHMDTHYLICLKNVIKECLRRPSFVVLTIHDEFKCLANYMNYLRIAYTQVFAELARSTLIDDILSEITGETVKFHRFGDGNQLAELILKSNYMIS